MKIGTHNGVFHADDLLAVASIKICIPDATVIRTRDANILKECDIVIDVGNVYDVNSMRYDHHQQGGAGQHAGSDIKYSSFGLVWKAWGENIVSTVLYSGHTKVRPSLNDISYCWQYVNDNLVMGVDALDNGQSSPTNSIVVSRMLSMFNPSWYEAKDERNNHDTAFENTLAFARRIIENTVKAGYGIVSACSIVQEGVAACNNRIMVLDKFCPWIDSIHGEDPNGNVLYVVFPSETGEWMVQAVPDAPGSFGKRKPLPSNWGGLRASDLDNVTGIEGCVFCHNGLFIAGNKTREGAIAMAKLAVDG
jgi:uncharacterized UPF0160 family protein